MEPSDPASPSFASFAMLTFARARGGLCLLRILAAFSYDLRNRDMYHLRCQLLTVSTTQSVEGDDKEIELAYEVGEVRMIQLDDELLGIGRSGDCEHEERRM